MYHDLKYMYWLNDLKSDIAEYVAWCPNCQQVKTKHRRHDSLAQTFNIQM